MFEHKIKTLQEEIKPKEDKIKDLEQQILDMERELTKSVKDQGENVALIEDTKSKLATSSSELLAGRRKVAQLQTSYGR